MMFIVKLCCSYSQSFRPEVDLRGDDKGGAPDLL